MRERDIFIEALEKDNPSDRAALLDDACQGNSELRKRVERLLADHDLQKSFILDKSPAVFDATIDFHISERPGTVIGPYKLLQQIGEGGMGVVFMAEQSQPIQRTVALKIIKPGMDTRQVIARFEAERQAVAMMDHPNIAKVLDAGTTESGRPYFVMELVKGVPITKYCDDKHLPLRARLELFIEVCQAVQHAHQKGIIHRDIKPTNVLVAEYDNHAVPKVIDFGVAKATAHRLTDRTMFTEFGQIVGTMEYMSPEQAKLNQLDIDTRSDIYSLGVLLYELLTGSTPFEGKRLHEAAFDEMLRIIREEEPQKPSTRLSTTDQLPSIAANRGAEPSKLTGVVRRELDWVVMKALEKDRNRRYETANGLAGDVNRYLNDEAVEAGPPSATYRFRKFARRNRLALTTGLLVAAALLLGTVVSTWQAIRAEQARSAEAAQREIAERERIEADKQRKLAEANLQKARQAVDEYFTLISESRLLEVPGMQPLRKELLEGALRYYQTMLDERTNDPALLTDLALAHIRTSKVYHELDRNDDALAAIKLGVQLVQQLRRNFPHAVEQQRRLAGYWTVHRGVSSSTERPKDLAAAISIMTEFLQLWEMLASENPSVEAFQNDVAAIYSFLSQLEGSRGAGGEAPAFARAAVNSKKSIAIWERLSELHPDNLAYRENLARSYDKLTWELNRAGEPEQAREASAKAAALQAMLSSQSPHVPTYRALTATKLAKDASALALKQPQEAEAAYREAVQAWQQLAADFPAAPQYAIELSRAQGKFVQLLAGPLKRPDEAKQLSSELVELLTKLAAENRDSPSLRREAALVRRELADRLVVSKEDLVEAEKLHRQTLADFKELAAEFPDEPQHVEHIGHSYRYLGWMMRDAKRFDDAVAYLEQGAATFQQLADAVAPLKYSFYRDMQADTLINNAFVLIANDQLEDGESTARQAVEIYETLARNRPDNADYQQKAANSLRVLATLLVQQGKLDEALAAAQKSVRLTPNDFYSHSLVLDVLTRLGDPEQTLAAMHKNVSEMPNSGMAHHHLATAFYRQDRHEDAIVEFRKTIELEPKWEWPHLCIASSYASLGRWDIATDEYATGFEMDPPSWGKVVESLNSKNQPEESAKVLRKLLAIADERADDARGRLIRASLHRELGEREKAIEVLTWVIEQDPDLVEAWDLRGQCYADVGDYSKSEADFSAGIKLSPERAALWTGRAWSHLHRQQWDDAISDYTQAIKLAPQVHTNWFHRGLAYMHLAQWDKAAADFSKVIEGWGHEPSGWYLRALAYAQLEQPDRALADLRQAIAKGYDNVEELRTEPKLDPLRANEEFKKLLEELDVEKE